MMALSAAETEQEKQHAVVAHSVKEAKPAGSFAAAAALSGEKQ